MASNNRNPVIVGLQMWLFLTIMSAVKSLRICQNFQFVLGKDVVDEHALDGHVFQRYTVKSTAQCHIMCKENCRCISFNYLPSVKENNCELNDANKELWPDSLKLKSRAQYYDLVRSYTVEGRGKYVPAKDMCVNRCCEPNPCLHAGRCQEICDPSDVRFNCTCPTKYLGKRCELRCYESCKEAFDTGFTKSGRYILCNGQSAPFFVYCDMESEPKFIWTLIQSFSFDQRGSLEDKWFGVDYPVGVELPNINWNFYRLSLPHMQYLASQSTNLRVTCNFSAEGLSYTDYLRTVLKTPYIFKTFDGECRWYAQLNIRGMECFSCSALTSQKEGRAWFINSYSSYGNGCQFDGRPGIGSDEHNFGRYADGKVNRDHRCSASNSSTTEHWFGIKKK